MANLTIANAPNGALAGTSLATSHKLPTSGDFYITADELLNGLNQLSDVYRVNTEAELTSAIAGAKNTILVDGDITLTGNHTVTQHLIIRNGAVITTDSNNLTINGPFTHGLSQCFSGSGVTFGLNTEVRPEWWGAARDGETDDLSPLIYCVAALTLGGTIKLAAGSYGKSDVLTLASNISVIGAGKSITSIDNLAANKDGVVVSGCTSIKLSNFTISCKSGDTTNSGIYCSSSGISGSSLEHLIITGFQYAVEIPFAWRCHFNDIRSNNSVGYSFYFNSSVGNWSDNLMTMCYANAPGDIGFVFVGCKKSVLIGNVVGDSTHKAFYFGTNSQIDMIGGNVEEVDLSGVTTQGVIEIWSGSVVSIKGFTFQSCTGPSSGYTSLIFARETSKVFVTGCYEIGTSGNVYALETYNTSMIYHLGNSFSSAISQSSATAAIVSTSGRHTIVSGKIDLSGSAYYEAMLHPAISGSKGYIIGAKIIYTEGSSGDAGVALKLGRATDDDLFFSETTEASKALWYTKTVTLLSNRIPSTDEPIILTCAGGKAGTGEVQVSIEYYLTS